MSNHWPFNRQLFFFFIVTEQIGRCGLMTLTSRGDTPTGPNESARMQCKVQLLLPGYAVLGMYRKIQLG